MAPVGVGDRARGIRRPRRQLGGGDGRAAAGRGRRRRTGARTAGECGGGRRRRHDERRASGPTADHPWLRSARDASQPRSRRRSAKLVDAPPAAMLLAGGRGPAPLRSAVPYGPGGRADRWVIGAPWASGPRGASPSVSGRPSGADSPESASTGGGVVVAASSARASHSSISLVGRPKTVVPLGRVRTRWMMPSGARDHRRGEEAHPDQQGQIQVRRRSGACAARQRARRGWCRWPRRPGTHERRRRRVARTSAAGGRRAAARQCTTRRTAGVPLASGAPAAPWRRRGWGRSLLGTRPVGTVTGVRRKRAVPAAPSASPGATPAAHSAQTSASARARPAAVVRAEVPGRSCLPQR